MPKRLLRLLPEHEVKTAYQMGWAAKKNGELLKLVESADYYQGVAREPLSRKT